MTVKTISPEFPEKLNFIFKPKRYKLAKGGRGSGKSWGFARAIVLKGVTQKLRILCAREVQLSIKQSVHKLLKDQIELLEISDGLSLLAAVSRLFHKKIKGKQNRLEKRSFTCLCKCDNAVPLGYLVLLHRPCIYESTCKIVINLDRRLFNYLFR